MIKLITVDGRVLECTLMPEKVVVLKLNEHLEGGDVSFTGIKTKQQLSAFIVRYQIDERHFNPPKPEPKQQIVVGKIHISDGTPRGTFCHREINESTIIPKWRIKQFPRDYICNICYEHVFPKGRKGDLNYLAQILTKRAMKQVERKARNLYTESQVPDLPITTKGKVIPAKKKMLKIHVLNPNNGLSYCMKDRDDSPFIEFEDYPKKRDDAGLCKQCNEMAKIIYLREKNSNSKL